MKKAFLVCFVMFICCIAMAQVDTSSSQGDDSIAHGVMRSLQRHSVHETDLDPQDSVILKSPPAVLTKEQAADIVSRKVNGRMIYLSRIVETASFQPLPYFGTYKETIHYYSIRYEKPSWHVSKAAYIYDDEGEGDTHYKYLIVAAYMVAVTISMIFLFLSFYKVEAPASVEELLEYKYGKMNSFERLAYLIIPFIAVAQIIFFYLQDGEKLGFWLVISYVWWIILLELIIYLLKHGIINSRIVKKVM